MVPSSTWLRWCLLAFSTVQVNIFFICIKKNILGPDWCGLVCWALSCKGKGGQFDSRSGHIPGLWFSPWLVRIQEAANRYFSVASRILSLSVSFPSLSKMNKWNLQKNILGKLFWCYVNAPFLSFSNSCPLIGTNFSTYWCIFPASIITVLFPDWSLKSFLILHSLINWNSP